MVEEYICKMLKYENEIVIPAFGIIKGTYASATIHPTQHLFIPPHKSLSFHHDIKANNTRLISFISSEEHISEDKAAEMIDYFVKDIHESLNAHGHYLMKGIGKIFLDIEKQLRFTADPTENLLLSSYGLHDFVSNPILRPKNSQVNSSMKSDKEKKKRRFIWFRF
jgi:nucleoid DNA-binding protein